MTAAIMLLTCSTEQIRPISDKIIPETILLGQSGGKHVTVKPGYKAFAKKRTDLIKMIIFWLQDIHPVIPQCGILGAVFDAYQKKK